mgnify:CR=1 FL=1
MYSFPTELMPETGKIFSFTANSQINKIAVINTGILYPIIVPTCTAKSRLLPFFAAQNIPKGMVMRSADTVAKKLRKRVLRSRLQM